MYLFPEDHSAREACHGGPRHVGTRVVMGKEAKRKAHNKQLAAAAEAENPTSSQGPQRIGKVKKNSKLLPPSRKATLHKAPLTAHSITGPQLHHSSTTSPACSTAPLPHGPMSPLPHCPTVPLLHCITAPPLHRLTMHQHYTASLLHHFTHPPRQCSIDLTPSTAPPLPLRWPSTGPPLALH